MSDPTDAERLAQANTEIDRLRGLFQLDGEQHANHVRELTKAHESRITKYAEKIATLSADSIALRKEIDALRGLLDAQKLEVERLRGDIADAPNYPDPGPALNRALKRSTRLVDPTTTIVDAVRAEVERLAEHLRRTLGDPRQRVTVPTGDAIPPADDVEAPPFVSGAQSEAVTGVPTRKCADTTVGESCSTSSADDAERPRNYKTVPFDEALDTPTPDPATAALISAAREQGRAEGFQDGHDQGFDAGVAVGYDEGARQMRERAAALANNVYNIDPHGRTLIEVHQSACACIRDAIRALSATFSQGRGSIRSTDYDEAAAMEEIRLLRAVVNARRGFSSPGFEQGGTSEWDAAIAALDAFDRARLSRPCRPPAAPEAARGA